MSQRTPAADVTALSVEFVAKPQETYRLHSAIPASIERTLAEVTGFSGCLVMTSDQEARLVTVLIFWSGNERAVAAQTAHLGSRNCSRLLWIIAYRCAH